MFASFNIEYQKSYNNQDRREIFNLKNGECQSKFFEETNSGLKFQQCFSFNGSFEAKCNKFLKTLDDTLHKCFKKIRIKKSGASIGGAHTEVQDLIMEKSKLSLSLPSIECMLGRQIVEDEIIRIEEKISEISASRNASIVRDFVKKS